MALKYSQERRAPSGTGTNTSLGQRPRTSLTNGSSSRKYTGKDLVINGPTGRPGDTKSKSNSNHLVSAAVGMKTAATVGSSILAEGRDALATTRAQLREAIGSLGSANQGTNPPVDENSLRIFQMGLVGSVRDRLGVHPSAAVDSLLSDNVKASVIGSLKNFMSQTEKGQGSAVNSSVPEIDYIEVQINEKRPIRDIFYATVVFDLPNARLISGDISGVRIFRATVDDPRLARRAGLLTVQGVSRLQAESVRTHVKNEDDLGNFGLHLQQLGVSSAISVLNPVDPFVNVRRSSTAGLVATSTDHFSAVDNQTSKETATAAAGSWVHPGAFLNVDRSVLNDLNSLRNIQIQNPMASTPQIPPATNAARSMIVSSAARIGTEQLRQARDSIQFKSPYLIDRSNKLDFKELALLSANKLDGQIVGDRFETTFVDPTISYGKSYLYYILSIDRNMVESQRSRIVQIKVDGLRVPAAPSALSAYTLNTAVSLSMLCDDLLVEKFEVYRNQLTGVRGASQSVISVHGQGGYHVSNIQSIRLANGFSQIGECLAGPHGGSTFYDRLAQPGNKYVYRVYTVDVFGNKSESPREIEVFWPEGVKHVDLAKPTLKSEVDLTTGKVRLTIRCDDSRVTALFLSRRDVTVGQNQFVVPNSPERIRLGQSNTVHRRLDDPHLVPTIDSSLNWNGFFQNTHDNIIFLDNTTYVDRTYQYSVRGMDRFGNGTPIETAPLIIVPNRAQIFEPKNLSATIEQLDGSVSGVRLSWDDTNVDTSAEDLIGNQEDLRESAVRTLFQVERREVGVDMWVSFPMVAGNELFDTVASVVAVSPLTIRPVATSENYQIRQLSRLSSAYVDAATRTPAEASPSSPSPVTVNSTYVYRVQAFQTGGFISNFSNDFTVTVVRPVLPPQNFVLNVGDTKTRPFYVGLNWDDASGSGIIDRWDIERAEVNNYAAASLNNRNPADFAKISYFPFKTVYSESSRFRERLDDISATGSLATDPKGLLTGQNHYIDQETSFGNTYFYRIRSIAAYGGSVSGWVYAGTKVTDDVFEKKQEALVTHEEKVNLSQVMVPLVMKKTVQQVKNTATNSSLRLIPPTRVLGVKFSGT